MARPVVPFGNVGSMGGNFVGDYAVFHVFFIRQAEMFFRRDVAQHRGAKPADHRRTDR